MEVVLGRFQEQRDRSDAWFPLGQAMIRRSQLPDVLHAPDGTVYHRPPHWN